MKKELVDRLAARDYAAKGDYYGAQDAAGIAVMHKKFEAGFRGVPGCYVPPCRVTAYDAAGRKHVVTMFPNSGVPGCKGHLSDAAQKLGLVRVFCDRKYYAVQDDWVIVPGIRVVVENGSWAAVDA